MIFSVFGLWFRTVLQRGAVLLVSLVLVVGLLPGAAWAASSSGKAPHLPLALAASSRFAAPTDEELNVQKMTEARREELREQRREWQNQVSEEAYDEVEQAEDARETVQEKLNLEEIVEENEILNSD